MSTKTIAVWKFTLPGLNLIHELVYYNHISEAFIDRSAKMMYQENEDKSNESKLTKIHRLAFVSLFELEKDLFRGGLLISDNNGKPLEFRCTTPLKPTAVQKTLYGSTLKTHMAIELTTLPLLKSSTEQPDIVIVNDFDIMDLRRQIDLPLLFVEKQGSNLINQNEFQERTKSELISSKSGKFSPVVITSHWEFYHDIRDTLQDLNNMFTRFDLIEPFERIQNALRLLHEQSLQSTK